MSTTYGGFKKRFQSKYIPRTYINMEKQYIIENESTDPLPIVELKPFVKKVWRREKSLPSFYDMLPPIQLCLVVVVEFGLFDSLFLFSF
jgi:hypothetical protein